MPDDVLSCDCEGRGNGLSYLVLYTFDADDFFDDGRTSTITMPRASEYN